jgi:hypothetical protein
MMKKSSVVDDCSERPGFLISTERDWLLKPSEETLLPVVRSKGVMTSGGDLQKSLALRSKVLYQVAQG